MHIEGDCFQYFTGQILARIETRLQLVVMSLDLNLETQTQIQT